MPTLLALAVAVAVAAPFPRRTPCPAQSVRNRDGIVVSSPGTVVARNVAVANGERGIDASPGVVDGGGNRAWGHGNPTPCRGVSCA